MDKTWKAQKKKSTQLAKSMKRCSMSSVTWKLQIKTQMRYRYTSSGRARDWKRTIDVNVTKIPIWCLRTTLESWVKSGKIYQDWTNITPGPNNSTPKRIANQSAHRLHQKKQAEQPVPDTQLWVTGDSYMDKHMAGRMGRPPLATQQ